MKQKYTAVWRGGVGDLGPQMDFKKSLLRKICYLEQEEEIKAALARGEDVNYQGGRNQTCLMAAASQCSEDHHKIIRLLLDHPSIEVNMADDKGCTALHWATMLGRVEAVKILLADKRVDVNIQNADNLTVLMYAARKSSENQVSILKLLLEQPSTDVNLADDDGLTALHGAIDSKNIEAVRLMLADKRVNANCEKSSGITPLLMAAAEADNIEIFKLLLSEPRVDVNLGDKEGVSPLHRAVVSGNTEAVKLLLADARVDVNCKNCDQMTPLIWATSKAENIDMFRLLLSDQRVNVNLAGTIGKRGGDMTALMVASHDSNVEAVKLLLDDERVDVNWTSDSGMRAVHIAAGVKGRIKIMELFLAHPRVDVICKRPTLLHHAVAENNVEAVKLMLAEPRFTSADVLDEQAGVAAVRIAAVNGYWAVLKELVLHPSTDLAVKDKDGWSVDDLAR